MNVEYEKNISKEQAFELLDKFNFEIDNDPTLDKKIEEYYFVENIGYLIIFDILDEAILYKSKNDYRLILNRDTNKYYEEINIEEVIKKRSFYIDSLKSNFNLNIDKNDTVINLEILDEFIKTTDPIIVQKNFSSIIAYFYSCLSNQLESKGWKYESNDNGYLELIIVGKDDSEYSGFYGKIWEMIFEGDKSYTLISIANIILSTNPFKLGIDKG